MISKRRQPKFTPGNVIGTAAELLSCNEQGRWVYFGSSTRSGYGKPRAYHPSWICNMQFARVCGYIKSGLLRYAVRNTDFGYVFDASSEISQVSDNRVSWYLTCSELPAVTPIKAFSKEAAIEAVEDAVREHVGPYHKIVIKWDAPETYAGTVPLRLK